MQKSQTGAKSATNIQQSPPFKSATTPAARAAQQDMKVNDPTAAVSKIKKATACDVKSKNGYLFLKYNPNHMNKQGTAGTTPMNGK